MKSHTAFWRWTAGPAGQPAACAQIERLERVASRRDAARCDGDRSSSLTRRRSSPPSHSHSAACSISMADAARLFLLLVAVAAALAGRSDGAWCVCRPELGDSALQKTLDYACGDGADCKPILQNGPCFAPDTVRAHCSYAVNSFYQRNNQNAQACVFSGTATLVSTDPSGNGCTYPATPR
ncbi:hypothetical protein SETIT_9G087500v2 [Setaria italica]|uniref:X8 domain-containing protein n=1 Tax=Setaria italica TaxID=4555 RepID=A0A368SEI6_SETIT|nr:hypothetical protein SETIT_9G087500v2 [Setaria italica]